MPKFNMYQSLHTTVIGPEGKPVEIQIRTHTMHRRAEYGVAAHWKYKEDGARRRRTAPGRARPAANDMAWLRQLLDWQKETADPGEFLDSLRFEINAREVYVFTPKGEVVGAAGRRRRPVDFAYAVHTEVGHHCIGAPGQRPPRAAGVDARERRRRRGAHLQGRRRPGPSRDWLAFVKSAAGPQQDPPVVLQGAPRGGDRARQGRHRQGDAQAGPAAPAAHVARVARRRSPTELRYAGRRRRCTPRSARATSRPSTSSAARAVARWRGGRQRGPRRGATIPTPAARAAAHRRPRCRRQGRRRRLGQAGPVLHAGAGRPDHRASSPAATASPCTARDCTNADACCSQPDRIVEVEWAPDVRRASSWCRSRSRRSTATGCSPTSPGCCRTTHVNILSASVHDLARPGGHLAVHLRDGRPGATSGT